MKKLFILLMKATILLSLVESSFAFNPRRTFKKKCSKCHTIGEGVKKAADLADLESRTEKAKVVHLLVSDEDPNHKFSKYKGSKVDELLEYIYAKGAGSTSDIKAGKGNFAAGRYLSTTCVACHGAAGYARNNQFPNLRGQNAQYLINQMMAFKNKTRLDPNGSMNAMTQSLTERDIVNLATYYSQLNN